MFIAVLAKDGDDVVDGVQARVLSALERHRIPHERFDSVEAARGDVVVAIGDNPFLLKVFRRLATPAPVLGVGSAGFGVLTETTVDGFESNLRRLAAGEYRVEEVDRMACRIGDRDLPPALNEAAIVAREPGHLVRYSLWVADELVYRDRGDGLIVATPTGSTAYALAAGGAVVLSDTPVFSVVPICSSDGNRPLVVSAAASLAVTDATADAGVELVLDGRERFAIARGERVAFDRAAEPARFVRFGEPRFTQMLGRMKTSGDAAGSLKDAPPSAKFLAKLLEYEGPLTQQEMVRESELAERTVRNAVAYLVTHGVIRKEPSLRDARQDVYSLAPRRG